MRYVILVSREHAVCVYISGYAIDSVMFTIVSFSAMETSFSSPASPKVVHDDAVKWKHFPRYWTFVQGIHRSPVNSPHKSQWRGALMFSLICAWINGWVNNREAGDLRRHCADCDVTVMWLQSVANFVDMKRKYCHFDEKTMNFVCNKWWQFCQNDDIHISVFEYSTHLMLVSNRKVAQYLYMATQYRNC